MVYYPYEFYDLYSNNFYMKLLRDSPNIFSVPILCSSFDFEGRLILFGTSTGQINCLNAVGRYDTFSEVGAISAGQAQFAVLPHHLTAFRIISSERFKVSGTLMFCDKSNVVEGLTKSTAFLLFATKLSRI